MAYTAPKNIADRPVAVIGAGTLGRRIALMFAAHGTEARIFDPSPDACAAAVAFVEKQKSSVAGATSGGKAVAADSQGSAVRGAWLVIEAVPERLDLKKKIFEELDADSDADAILASNSSSYPTEQFITGVKNPERVVNLHFYMPPVQNAADLMANSHTDQGVIDVLLKELPKDGIHPFVAHKQSTGFIFNRIWAAVKRECLSVVAEGVSTPQDVDAMWCLNMGTKMGPFRMMDRVGLDVVLDIENHYAEENPHLPEGPRKLLRKYVDAGHLGVKTGQGFYDDYPKPS
ncbi:3-hydroxyacyl-CoA dehydrogenase family protein [Actinocorallia lasiicapitis]